MSIDKIDQEVKEKYSEWKYILPRALESRFHSTDTVSYTHLTLPTNREV